MWVKHTLDLREKKNYLLENILKTEERSARTEREKIIPANFNSEVSYTKKVKI